MTTHQDCPNCGANLRVDGDGDFARCRFCGTVVAVPARRSRSELEAERDDIRARENERAAEIKEAKARGIEDFIIPPIGCCGIYVGLFVVGSLILSAIGAEVAKRYGTVVAAIAIGAALVGTVYIIVRSERRRAMRVATLEQQWKTDYELRQRRLRQIEAELETYED